MSWAKTPRILLVWPKYEKVTLRQVDLKILQRHAAFLGAQLGLVTRTRRVREEAEALRIPVFESTGQAQKVSWPTPRRKRLLRHAPRKDLREKREQVQVQEEAWRTNPAVRLGMFSVGVLSVLVLVALFIPRAQVTLSPVSTMQSITLPVTASPSIDSVFITGNIPAREKRVIVEGEHTVVVTGEGVVPQSKARGVALFRNLTQQSVAIPEGTILQAAQDALVRFVTLEDGVVEAGVGKTIELPVEALEGGIAGNLPADTLIVIEGRLGLSLSVNNPEPTTGGRERASVQASESDHLRAKNLLMKSLDEMAREKVKEEINDGDMVFEETLNISQILLEEYDPPAGAAGTNLTLSMQVEYSVNYAAASDLIELTLLAMNASLPSGFRAASASDAVILNPVTNLSIDENGTARWTMKVEREIVQDVNPAQVTYLIQGYNSGTAQARLEENIPLAASPKISLSPSWWPWVPIVPFRISVVTQ